jgi:hypothetical protein
MYIFNTEVIFSLNIFSLKLVEAIEAESLGYGAPTRYTNINIHTWVYWTVI